MIGVCRYCGCTDGRPCLIPLNLAHPDLAIGRHRAIVGTNVPCVPCAWLLADVCDAPACVEKAYMDVRNSAEELTRLLEDGIRIEFEDAA